MRNFILLTIIASLSFVACNKEDMRTSQEVINDYVEENNLAADTIMTASGLVYIEREEGTGASPTLNNTVEVTYRGKYTDGVVFDAGREPGANPISFPLTGVIPGFAEGLTLMKKGGAATLIIPSELGYGSNPPFGSGIRSNAVLVFDTELVDF